MLHTTYLGFDHRRSPFDDPRVRQAFAMAIDRDGLAASVKSGFSFSPRGGFMPPGMPGHSDGISVTYDPELARRRQAESGYPGGRGFPPIKCSAPYPHPVCMTPYFQEHLLVNLGIELDWQLSSFNVFVRRLLEEPPQM
jgi:oligopeptide transport system substrate-binding protein